MPITSSEILEDSVQIDERRQVREYHEGSDLKQYYFSFMAEKDQDVEKTMADRAVVLSDLIDNPPEVVEAPIDESSKEYLAGYDEGIDYVLTKTVKEFEDMVAEKAAEEMTP